jgi:phage terminase small subunit
MTKDLTPKQERFVEEYLVDLNATQAAIRAGYSEKTARFIGAENLTKPNVQRAIQKASSELTKKVGIDQERVLTEEKRIAFSDIRAIFDENGTQIKPNELPEEVSRSIAKIEVIDSPMGKPWPGLKRYLPCSPLNLQGNTESLRFNLMWIYSGTGRRMSLISPSF